jgi:hypothetical protein
MALRRGEISHEVGLVVCVNGHHSISRFRVNSSHAVELKAILQVKNAIRTAGVAK